MPARRFIPATIVAAGIWAFACTMLGYVFWNSFDRAVELAKQGSFVIAGLVVLVVAGTLAVHRYRRTGDLADATAGERWHRAGHEPTNQQ